MAVNLSPVGGVAAQFFDNSGQVLTGGKLYTYLAGTTTPAVTYTTNSGLTANSNPIVLNAAGRVADSGEIWLTDGINYKFVLKDSNDVQIAVWDNIIGINSNFVNYTLQEQTFTATQGQTVFTLTGGLQYTPATNNLSVFVNGSKQVAGTNYLETSTTVFTFVTGLNVGDVVDAITAIPVATNVISSVNVSYNQGGTGAVTTNVQAKLQQTVSVKDFGAVGNGTTDDTSAIQAAINSISAAQGGYQIYFPPGIYKTTAALIIGARRIIFRGSGVLGSNSTTIKQTSNANAHIIDASGVVDTFSIFGLELYGAGSGTGTGSGIVLGTVYDSRIEGCWFTAIPNASLLCQSISGVHITNNGFENANYGIYMPNTATNNSNNVISNNRFYSNATAGIEIDTPGANANLITSNLFDQNLYAIRLNTSSTEIRGTHIGDNLFRANTIDVLTAGTGSRATHTGVTDLSIASNHSEQAQNQSILINTADGVSILSNTLIDGNQTNGGYSAIDISSTSKSVSLDGNVIRNATAFLPTYSVNLSATSTLTFIGSNDIASGSTGIINYQSGATYTQTSPRTGTWTPVLSGATTTTYTIQEGYYVKIGPLVYVKGKIAINSLGNGSVTTIDGLPFASSNAANSSVSSGTVSTFISIATSAITLTPVVANNGSTISFIYTTASSTSMSSVCNVFQNGARVDFSLTYQAAS